MRTSLKETRKESYSKSNQDFFYLIWNTSIHQMVNKPPTHLVVFSPKKPPKIRYNNTYIERERLAMPLLQDLQLSYSIISSWTLILRVLFGSTMLLTTTTSSSTFTASPGYSDRVRLCSGCIEVPHSMKEMEQLAKRIT